MSFQEFTDDDLPREACAEGAPLAGKTPRMRSAALPRVVTTGRKFQPHQKSSRFEDTGERCTMHPTGVGVKVVRHLDPLTNAVPNAALIDALAFTVIPPASPLEPYAWVLREMRRFLPVESVKFCNGMAGFTHSALLPDGAGKIAWGGESQKGRVFFSLMGAGCSMVKDWAALQAWLQKHRARITRADVAYDDFEGELINIAWAVEQYKNDGFTAGGRKPRHTCIGDWLDGDTCEHGLTLNIGSRASGKLVRFYQKGKQLGQADSPWTRVEVEWRAQDRHIPYDILTKPGQYLAGAYPCLSFLDKAQCVIKTVSKAAQIVYGAAVENGKRSVGKLVNLMLHVYGGDYAQVVEQLRRDGYPSRIEPYSYHVRLNPAMLDAHPLLASP